MTTFLLAGATLALWGEVLFPWSPVGAAGTALTGAYFGMWAWLVWELVHG